jgi:hypothetical protein
MLQCHSLNVSQEAIPLGVKLWLNYDGVVALRHVGGLLRDSDAIHSCILYTLFHA